MTAPAGSPTRAKPRPIGAPPPPPDDAPPPTEFSWETGIVNRPERVVIYGTHGIGKSTTAATAPLPGFVDLEGSSDKLDVPRIRPKNFAELRTALHNDALWDKLRTVVIDTGTKLQEFAAKHTIATVPHEKGHMVKDINGYGFGKGFEHIADTFLLVLGDLDAHVRKGRNVIMVCHETVEKAPNPEGEDYLCYQPDLQQPPKNGRLRDRVAQWADHLLFVGYDITVKDGKAKGQGTRTVYSQERPTWWAKSRSLRDPIPLEEGSTELWDTLGLA